MLEAVGVTAHRRPWMRWRQSRMGRAAACAVITGGAIVALTAVATPAYADPPTFGASASSSLNDFHPGDSQTYKVTATNDVTSPEPGDATMTASLSMSPASDFTVTSSGGGGCSGGGQCTFTFGTNGTINVTFTITAKSSVDVPAGSKAAASLTVGISDGTTNKTLQDNANLFGPTPAVVVSGAVYNQDTGSVISGAIVIVQDSANHTYSETTPSSGKFSFTATTAKPLVGSLVIGATKDKFKTVPMQINAGSSTGLHLLLKPIAVVAPSATPTPTPSTPASSSASLPATGAGGASGSGAASNGVAASDLNSGGGSSFGTFILIAGIVLIIGGGAAIGFILWRRKKRDDEGYDETGADADPYNPRGGRGGTGPDRTRVAPSLGDAPTMMHRGGLVDEFADPYGAPPRVTRPTAPAPRQPGYGQPGFAAADPYASGPGYGAETAYPGAQTEMYRPPTPRPPADPYQQPYPPQAPTYAPEPNGYAGYPAGGAAGPAGGPNGYQPAPPRGGAPGQAGYGGRDYPPATPPPPAYPADNGYGRHDQPGYGSNQPGYGAEAPGYGAEAPGYGAGAGYDAAGAGYNDPAAAGYQAGYDASPGYQPYPGEYGAGQPGYQQGGYNADSGYQPDGYQSEAYPPEPYPQEQPYQPGAYPQEPYRQDPYTPEPDAAYPPQSGAYPPPAAPPQQPGYQQSGPGYRGGYTPPEQRGSVDWLDD